MIEKLKKIGLSLSVIVLFALYAGQRQAQTGSTAASVAAIYTPGVTTASESNHVAATVTPQTSSTSVAASSGPNTHTSARAVAVATVTPTGAYRNGTYTGTQADAHWGTVEVVAVITNGQLSDVQFVQYPNHRNLSKEINYQAMPMLTQEAIQSQRADVDIISGATDTSEAFITSLSSALAQAAS
jgi:uncharacterized protein with FMN-binding domain